MSRRPAPARVETTSSPKCVSHPRKRAKQGTGCGYSRNPQWFLWTLTRSWVRPTRLSECLRQSSKRQSALSPSKLKTENSKLRTLMASTRALVKRRKAIRNIRKITRTMELIATARFKRALDRATEADAYTRKIAELAADLSTSATNISHPLLQTRPEVKSSLLLVITSNRGLCGGYNASLIREASHRVRQIKQES